MPVAGFAYDFTGISGRVIAVWYKNNNLSAEINRKVLDLPNGEGSFSVENLQSALYVFKFYQSSDGSTLETFLRQITYNAKTNKLLSETFEYVAGRGQTGDPSAYSNTLSDSRLDGALKSELEVKRRGVGTLRLDEFELYTGGGIQLQNGDVFGSQETIHITRTYKADVSADSSTSTTSEDVVTFSSNLTFDAATHMGKTLALVGGADTVVLTFPSFSSIIDGKVKINTNASTAIYLRIQFASGNSTYFYDANRNKILLGKGHFIELLFKSNVCYVTSPVSATGYDKVGETEYTNYTNKPNAWLCNGDGAEHLITTFERLFDLLPSEMKVTYAEWDQTRTEDIGNKTIEYYHNRGKFAVDTVNGKFKFPDSRGMSFRALKYFDGTVDGERMSQGAGGRQRQEIIEHGHKIKVTDGDQGPTLSLADGGNSAYPVTQSNLIIIATGGAEQRVDNDGKYVIVWI